MFGLIRFHSRDQGCWTKSEPLQSSEQVRSNERNGFFHGSSLAPVHAYHPDGGDGLPVPSGSEAYSTCFLGI